ncbi:hypothetical protein GCM10011324_43190 [Allosediminivita pacifica]|nr:hypothetical protein GCM10011324_43190 [Allosediminivita pacifica]
MVSCAMAGSAPSARAEPRRIALVVMWSVSEVAVSTNPAAGALAVSTNLDFMFRYFENQAIKSLIAEHLAQ